MCKPILNLNSKYFPLFLYIWKQPSASVNPLNHSIKSDVKGSLKPSINIFWFNFVRMLDICLI